MLTNTDIKKLKTIFATKEELKTTERYLTHKFDALEIRVNEFYNEFKEFKDSVLKTLDWLVGAFKKFDEEHAILSERYLSINKTIENHEDRITKLEKN